jgi:hypothetical protein
MAARLAAHPPAAAVRPRRPDAEAVLLAAYEISAGVYLAAAAAIPVLGILGLGPDSFREEGPLLHAVLAGAGGVTAGVLWVLYGIPRRLGGHLWSVRLGAVHLAGLHAVFAGGALAYHALALRGEVAWGWFAAVSVGLGLVWLACLVVNLELSEH